MFSKKGHAIFWDTKGPITIDFFEKGVTVNNTSDYQLLSQNSPYLLNGRNIYVCVCVCMCLAKLIFIVLIDYKT